MRQLIVLCLLTLDVINSAKISNDTGLKGLKELLIDGSSKPKKNVDLKPEAVKKGMSKAYNPIEALVKRIKILRNLQQPTYNKISNHSESSSSTPIIFRIQPKKVSGHTKYAVSSTIITTHALTTPISMSSPPESNIAEFDKIDDYVTEPVEQESDGEGPLENIPQNSKPGNTIKDNDLFLDEFPNSYSEDSHDKDESKKDTTSPDLLSEQEIQSQASENEHTPEDEDPVHSVSIADLVLNFRKAKLLKSRSGSNNTRHRHHHHRHHSKPYFKPSLKSRNSDKHDELDESRGRSGDRRDMDDRMYQHPDGYIVEEGADFGHEFYPNNNVVSIVHRSVIPAHAIPQRGGCLQCHSVPMALRKNMNPPINYFYNTLPGR